ncbi:MAG: hypothetical protein KF716_01635 [Anaerolineae bacterium]|nr:hypothetical protein [Anaerolineae bacterium]
MSTDNQLHYIQQLQFTDRPAAEELTLAFVRATFLDLDVTQVQLRPLAVSLNSFNGLLTLRDGRQLFFKTHVEPGSIVQEYYNSTLLAEAGYPIIKPLYASTEYGKQFLIYEMIESLSVFDVAHALERGERHDLDALTSAQQTTDDLLWDIYASTLQPQSAEAAGQAPVHQLFYHRLGTRYEQFYGAQSFMLPSANLAWDDLLSRRWIINGVAFEGTLASALDNARKVLCPERAGASIIGHGDAHNGNVFFTPTGLLYFDPAFGGRHHPLLDLTKPLFHNVFATWMYHPLDVMNTLVLTWHDDGTTIHVEHNYQPSSVRHMFFESKVQRVLAPLVAHTTIPAWRDYLKASLLCCPLLTMNLSDRKRFPAEIALLGLCYAIEMGLPSLGSRTILDNALANL